MTDRKPRLSPCCEAEVWDLDCPKCEDGEADDNGNDCSECDGQGYIDDMCECSECGEIFDESDSV